MSGDDNEVRGLARGGERAVHAKPCAMLQGALITEDWTVSGDVKVGKAWRENVDQLLMGDSIFGRFRLHQLRQRKPGRIAQPAEEKTLVDEQPANFVQQLRPAHALRQIGDQ